MAKRRAPSLALRLAACAVIGAALTIALSVACVMLAEVDTGRVAKGPRAWPVPMPQGAPPAADWMQEERGRGVSVRLSTRFDRSANTGWIATEVESGLPFPALTLKRLRQYPHPPVVINLTGGDRRQLLPNRPIARGFLIDTLVYATSAFALWTLFVKARSLMRRRSRRARGHCPACGYDLTASPTSTCPECGA